MSSSDRGGDERKQDSDGRGIAKKGGQEKEEAGEEEDEEDEEDEDGDDEKRTTKNRTNTSNRSHASWAPRQSNDYRTQHPLTIERDGTTVSTSVSSQGLVHMELICGGQGHLGRNWGRADNFSLQYQKESVHGGGLL